MRVQDFAMGFCGAPDWLLVREVTIETEGGVKTVLQPHELVDFEFPLAPFTVSVEVVPSGR